MNKTNWISRQWKKWGEMLVSRIFLPYSLTYFIINMFRYLKQRSKIKNALLSSQDLVDELDDNGFYLSEIDFYLFKFRTYALDSIQLLGEMAQTSENMHEDTLKRLVVDNVKELLKSRGKVIGQNTSLNIVQPQDKVLLIRLSPSWMRSIYVSSIDVSISLIISVLAFISWYFFF